MSINNISNDYIRGIASNTIDNSKGKNNIRIDENNKFDVKGDNVALANPKVKSLIKNDKVINMFTNIIKLNGGQDIKLSV